MFEGFYIDDLKSTDRDGLLDIMKSGTDYPYWYRNGQSHEAAADEYISYAKKVEDGQSNNQLKAIRTTDGRLIGGAVLVEFNKETGDAEIGCFLHQEYQGKGIGTEALFDVVQAAAANDGLKTLHSTLHPKKVASLRISLKLGLIVTGYQEKSDYKEPDGSDAPRVLMHATEHRLAAALERHFTPPRPAKVIVNTCVALPLDLGGGSH